MLNKNHICPQCKGRRTIIDSEAAIFTLGMSIIFKFRDDDGRKICPTCKGYGKI